MKVRSGCTEAVALGRPPRARKHPHRPLWYCDTWIGGSVYPTGLGLMFRLSTGSNAD